MNKRIIITSDWHFGIRSNNLDWFDIMKDYHESFFIPWLKENIQEGDVIYHLGDVFDNRQNVNLLIASYAIDLFERLSKIAHIHIILGNHDIYRKNTNDITSVDILKHIPNITIHKEPTIHTYGKIKCLLMPWRKDKDHEQESLAEYKNIDYLFCHSEVKGVALNAKVKNEHGSDVNQYNKYDAVYSGHIHYRQRLGKLNMVGVPYQLTRSDSGNQKGFWLVDLSNMEEQFFENHTSPKFVKFDLAKLYNTPIGDFKEVIRNNYVDLFVPSKIATTSALGRLINEIQHISRRIEPNIYDENDIVDKDLYDLGDIEEMYKQYDIMKLCDVYIDGMQMDAEVKERIKNKVRIVYDKCANNYDFEA